MNAINVIAPYKYSGMWVFDDARVGLVQEPFVEGADVIIDRAVESIPNAEDGFLLLFSATPFPSHQFRLSWRRADAGGNYYYSHAHNMEGWLCPALLKYFDQPPEELYFQIKPKPAENRAGMAPGEVTVSVEYRRHVGPRYVPGSVAVHFAPNTAFEFQPQNPLC